MGTIPGNGILIAISKNNVLARLNVIKEKTVGNNLEYQSIVDADLLNVGQMSDERTITLDDSNTTNFANDSLGVAQERQEQLTKDENNNTMAATAPPTEDSDNTENVLTPEVQADPLTPADEVADTQIEPPKSLAITAVTFTKKGSEKIGTIQENPNTPIGFKVEFNRELNQTEKVELKCAYFVQFQGETDYKEIPSSRKAIDISEQKKNFSFIFPENFSGAKIACSFFLNGPVTPKDNNEITVRYIDVLSPEGVLIKKVHWSEEKQIKFGEITSSRKKITKTEDGFLHIHTRGMYGKKVKVEILEHDRIGNPALLVSCENLIIKNNVLCLSVEMSQIHTKAESVRSIWAEGGDFDIFAKVTPLDESISSLQSDMIYLRITTKDKAKSALELTKKGVKLVPAVALLAGTAKLGRKLFGREREEEEEKDLQKGECVCKNFNLIWGNKVSCEFRKKVVEISKELWPNDYLNMANNLMAVFAWESGETFKAGVPNQANSGGTGLIQFMPKTAKSLLGKEITIENTSDFWGKSLKRVKEFAEMSEIKQLDYVKEYFKPLKNKKVEFVDFYLQVLFPVSALKENHIVFAKSLDEITTRLTESDRLKNLRVNAYSQNSGLDSNNDGVIWKDEIKEKVQKYITKGESNRATTFECKK